MRTILRGLFLLSCLCAVAPSAISQIDANSANKQLLKFARDEFKIARKSMKIAESSFRLKLQAFEIDIKIGEELPLLVELSSDLADLQTRRAEIAQGAIDAVLERAVTLLSQVENGGGVPTAFAPGAGGAVDKLAEDVLRYAASQRRRLLKRFARTRKVAGGKPDLRLTFILPAMSSDVFAAPMPGGELVVDAPRHDLRWVMAAGRGPEGGRLFAGGGRPVGVSVPGVELRSAEGSVPVELSTPQVDEWRLEAGTGLELLPPGNYLLQLWPNATQPGDTAAIGVR